MLLHKKTLNLFKVKIYENFRISCDVNPKKSLWIVCHESDHDKCGRNTLWTNKKEFRNFKRNYLKLLERIRILNANNNVGNYITFYE